MFGYLHSNPVRISKNRSHWISNNILYIIVVSESNQIDSLKNAQDDSFYRLLVQKVSDLIEMNIKKFEGGLGSFHL